MSAFFERKNFIEPAVQCLCGHILFETDSASSGLLYPDADPTIWSMSGPNSFRRSVQIFSGNAASFHIISYLSPSGAAYRRRQSPPA